MKKILAIVLFINVAHAMDNKNNEKVTKRIIYKRGQVWRHKYRAIKHITTHNIRKLVDRNASEASEIFDETVIKEMGNGSERL